MANYSVGNIEVGIVTTSKNTVSDLDNLIKKINKLDKLDKAIQDSFLSVNRLANGLQKISKLDMTKVATQMEKVSSLTKELNTNLNSIENPNFEATATALNKIANAFRQFDKLKDFDFRKMYNSFATLNRILDPFLTKLKQSEASLVALNGVLGSLKAKVITKATNEVDKLNKSSEKASKSTAKVSKNLNSMFTIGRLYFIFNYSKKIMQLFSKFYAEAINFEETLNKFQVSFGEFSNKATEFAENMAYAFNLSRQTLMDYMSTFNSMLKSLGGLSTSQAYSISTTLTQLALDYSSLFNVTVDSAMSAFQSVLSGQIRTIRSVSGIDVSENTIYQYYQELGGTKTVRNLTQIEKRLLRIYALERQMDALGAVGDLEKTINSSSNMIKQLQETFSELFVYVGNIVMQVFKPLIKYTLATTLALKDMAKVLSETLGALTTEYDNDSANSLFGAITEDAEEAEESVNSLLGLLSFDKFESLSSSTTSTTDDLDKIINALALYEASFSQISSDARKIADSMLSWLGFKYDEGTGGWLLGSGYTNIEKIRDTLVAIASLGLVLIIQKATAALGTFIYNLFIAEETAISLNQVLATGLATSLVFLILNFDNMNKQMKVLVSTLALVNGALLIFKNRLAIASVVKKLQVLLVGLDLQFKNLATSVFWVGAGLLAVVGAVAIFAFMDKMSAKTKTLVGVLGTLTAALMGVAAAYIAIQSAKAGAFAPVTIATIVGSIALGVASMTALVKGIKAYKDGGIVEQGQMFIANEAGAELVGSFDGQTGVANNDMITTAIEQASYRGFMRAMAQNQNSTNVTLNVSGMNDSAIARAMFNPMLDEAKRNGYNIKKA